MARRKHQPTRKGIIVVVVILLAVIYFTKTGQYRHNEIKIGPFNTSPEQHAGVVQNGVSKPPVTSNADGRSKVRHSNEPAELAERGPIDSIQLTRTYNSLSNKGAKLRCYLSGIIESPTDKQITTAKWTDYTSLASWGWEADQANADFSIVARSFPGVNFGTLQNGIRVSWSQSETTTHDNTVYKATNADYSNAFWPADGVIIANLNYGPAYQTANGLGSVVPWKNLPLPQLSQWSDVVFLTWAHLTTPHERNQLRWVFRRIIENQVTLDMIGYVAKKKGVGAARPANDKTGPAWRAPVWPGMVVSEGDEGYDALLATPNALGVAWLLVQHRDDMGPRTVRSIRVWNEMTDGDYGPSMLLEITPW